MKSARTSWRSEFAKKVLEEVISSFENQKKLSSSSHGRRKIINDVLSNYPVEKRDLLPEDKVHAKLMAMVYDKTIPTGSPNMPPLRARMKNLWYNSWQSSAINLGVSEDLEGTVSLASPTSSPAVSLASRTSSPLETDFLAGATLPTSSGRKRRRSIVDAFDDFTNRKYGKSCEGEGSGKHDFVAHPSSPIIFCKTCGFFKKLE